VVTKRELSNTAKLSVFKSVFIPILTYGHESWVKTENVISGASQGRSQDFSKGGAEVMEAKALKKKNCL